MINDNREVLDRLALALHEKDTLDHLELAEIFKDVKRLPPRRSGSRRATARCRACRPSRSRVARRSPAGVAASTEADAQPRDPAAAPAERTDASGHRLRRRGRRPGARVALRTRAARGDREDPIDRSPADPDPCRGFLERVLRGVPGCRCPLAPHDLGEPRPAPDTLPSGAVMLRDIAFRSMCEHHLLPFRGHAHVAYLPGEEVVGSVPCPVSSTFWPRARSAGTPRRAGGRHDRGALDARGVLVVLDATHECVTMRGGRQPDASTVTIAARGVYAEPVARAELHRADRSGSRMTLVHGDRQRDARLVQ